MLTQQSRPAFSEASNVESEELVDDVVLLLFYGVSILGWRSTFSCGHSAYPVSSSDPCAIKGIHLSCVMDSFEKMTETLHLDPFTRR